MGTAVGHQTDDLTVALDRSLANQLHQLKTMVCLRSGTVHAEMERLGHGAARLAEAVGLGKEVAADIRRVAPLRDIGNVAIPDAILLKRGPLDSDERALMQTHTLQGAHLLEMSPHPVLQLARTIALTHHERWDGRGYPRRLAGTDIPVAGRLTAIVDVFDALLSERPYKRAWPMDRAVVEMQRMRASRFDPDLLDEFLASCADSYLEGGGDPDPGHRTLPAE